MYTVLFVVQRFVLCVPFEWSVGNNLCADVCMYKCVRKCIRICDESRSLYLRSLREQGNQRIKFNWSDRARLPNTKIVNDFHFDNRF